MKKISIFFLWLLIIASGIAGFFFAPLWVFTALALYLLYKMSEEDVGLGKAVKDTVDDVGQWSVGLADGMNSFAKSIDYYAQIAEQEAYEAAQRAADELKQKRQPITFDEIHQAIQYLVDDKNLKDIVCRGANYAYLSSDIQYLYLKSGQWVKQGGYYVYCDEYNTLHFGYDYQDKHWAVLLHNDLRVEIINCLPINEGYCYGSNYQKLKESRERTIDMMLK